MRCFLRRTIIMLCALTLEGNILGQKVPPAPNHPWDASTAKQKLTMPPQLPLAPALDPAKVYTLAELVNIAEENNPDTRVAWEKAKASAADLGIAQSTLYPTVAAVAVASSLQADLFFGTSFQRQTIESFAPVFTVDYTIFDFGQRSGQISASRSKLLAANFQFNDTHRKIIFQVMQAYYRFLDTKGKEDVARANLKDAQTVQLAAEARLQSGLATLPDVLQARSAAAQADYDLQAAIGAMEIAHGDLAVSMGTYPTTQFQVESLQNLKLADGIADTVEASIDKALSQRPDLMQRVAELRAAGAEASVAHKAYFPTLQIEGSAGINRSYGVQINLPAVYSPTETTWIAKLSLQWTLFDGLAREKRLARAHAEQKQAAAAVDSARNQIENEVWSAYSTARTALRQQRAATALLAASIDSYNAALESYHLGLRTQIDVVSAQRTLASARGADIDARTQLLAGLAALAYETGDLLYAKKP